ncbi:b(0,+)-type amino acid transporter 1-like [Liolophura sinensis]|uniref:b(0,+)-type amino acid transporter 1-like n=1 Tax=Liolophura sinensis TaxID=3198878 RepID=UPI0031590434
MAEKEDSQSGGQKKAEEEVIVKTVSLKRNLGLPSGVALIIGTMIGSGIFISPRGVLEGTGSVAMSLIIWAACGLLATLGALSYAELGTAIPLSGGEHAYLMHTFAKGDKFWGPIPTFLYDWVGVFVIRPAMFGIMSLSLGTYATQPFYGDCEAPSAVKKLVTVVAMLLIAFINCFSVKIATKVQNFFTLAKLACIGVITIGGFVMLGLGNTEYISEGFEDTVETPSLIAMSFYNGLWAYDGWNNLNFVTEELKNPHKDLPRSIMIGIPLTTVCYVLANIGYFAVMSKEEIMLSSAVAVTWGERMLGIMAWIIPVFVVMSCFGAANGCLFASGRLCYVASREGHMPGFLSFIHANRLTPLPSLIFTVCIGILLVVGLGNLGSLIGFFSFAAWIFYGLTALSLVILRYTEPNLHRPYKVPVVVPVLVVIASVYLIIAPIIQNPQIEFLYAFLFVISGLIFYVPFVYMKLHLPHIDRFTRLIQILFTVVPPRHRTDVP